MSEEMIDRAYMQIQIDVYGAYDLVPAEERVEFEKRYGAWEKPNSGTGANAKPESETFLEIAAEATDPVEWAAMMLTKVGKPGMTRGEAMKNVRSIVRHAISLSQDSVTEEEEWTTKKH